MAIERVIKERGTKAFLARNLSACDGPFNIYTGALYRLYDYVRANQTGCKWFYCAEEVF